MPRQIIRNIFLFTVISFVERGINYLITFLLAVYLSPEELGKLSYVLTLQAYVYQLVLIYTSGAILLHYSKEDSSLDYFYSSSAINFFAFLLVALVTLITGLIVALPYPLVLLCLLVVLFLESIRVNYLAYNQALLNLKRYAAIAISFIVVNLLLTVLFLFLFPPQYEFRVYAILLSNVFSFLMTAWFLRGKIRFHLHREYIRDALSYGLPLLPHAFGLLFIESLNRYFLDGYGSKYELGLYSFAFTLAAPMGILNTAFNSAWVPHLYKLFQQDSDGARRKIMKVHSLNILFMLGVGILLSLLAAQVLSFFPDKYAGSATYLRVIPFYFCIQAVYMNFAAALFYFKKNRHFLYLAVVNIAVSLLANYLLFSRYGVQAAAYCSIASMLVFTLLVVILSQRIYPLPWLGWLASASGKKDQSA